MKVFHKSEMRTEKTFQVLHLLSELISIMLWITCTHILQSRFERISKRWVRVTKLCAAVSSEFA